MCVCVCQCVRVCVEKRKRGLCCLVRERIKAEAGRAMALGRNTRLPAGFRVTPPSPRSTRPKLSLALFIPPSLFLSLLLPMPVLSQLLDLGAGATCRRAVVRRVWCAYARIAHTTTAVATAHTHTHTHTGYREYSKYTYTQMRPPAPAHARAHTHTRASLNITRQRACVYVRSRKENSAIRDDDDDDDATALRRTSRRAAQHVIIRMYITYTHKNDDELA